jgi:para-aminobenzoate synthetase component 1
MNSEADAHLLRSYLADHGIKAWVEGGLALQSYAGLFRPRVVVPVGQADLAQQILRERKASSLEPLDQSSTAEPTRGASPTSAAGDVGQNVGPFGNCGPEVTEIGWPADMPELLRRLSRLPSCLFFESARVDSQLGKHSFFTADPFESIRSRRGRVVLAEAGQSQVLPNTDPLSLLADRWDRCNADSMPGLPPFQGGAAGFFSYDLCHLFEVLPRPAIDEFELPDLAVGFYDWVLALDHGANRAWIVSTGLPARTPEQQRNRALARIKQVQNWLNESESNGTVSFDKLQCARNLRTASELRRRQWPIGTTGSLSAITSNMSRDKYLRMVSRAIEYIRDGDVYQVNLAQRLLAPLNELPIDLYLRLRQRNPAPFAGYLDLGDLVIASASPERFLRVRNWEVETRPIKGTRPRWAFPEADMYSAGDLRASEKDRAENVMIVDLLRNDLGRVCEFGSVKVTAPLRLESYEFVHHLVSEVRGRLRPECGPIDLLRAAFPGGSVTGAPKIRAMEIIAELEPTARGPYCGSLGYIGFDGSMDSNILIRTFACSRGWAQFPVGGGIVAQSIPEREYEETLHKAEGMIRSLST